MFDRWMVCFDVMRSSSSADYDLALKGAPITNASSFSQGHAQAREQTLALTCTSAFLQASEAYPGAAGEPVLVGQHVSESEHDANACARPGQLRGP